MKIENWGSKMHMKVASFDGQFLVGGSMNWTAAGEGSNDENTLILHSSRLASQFDRYFDEIWNTIPDRWMQDDARPDPESHISGTSCFDGVDNDFDDRADEADPGCSHNPPPLPLLPPHKLVPMSQRKNVLKEYRLIYPTKCDSSHSTWYYCI